MRNTNSLVLPQRENPGDLKRGGGGRLAPGDAPYQGSLGLLVPEYRFLETMRLEQRRAERSGSDFLLMFLELEEVIHAHENAVQRTLEMLRNSIRATDFAGWYRQGRTVGVVFTAIDLSRTGDVEQALHARTSAAMRGNLRRDEIERIKVRFQHFPARRDAGTALFSSTLGMWRDFQEQDGARSPAMLAKRLIDIVGSVAALALLAPMFGVIAIAIKITSRGPVFYRQARVGQFGTRFTFLKFRSMYVNNDPAIHQEYIRSLIRGEAAAHAAKGAPGPVYKLTRDPRVTPFGGFLRKTSLDELPQFLNVVKGEMSLVGPRPPIPYELEDYDAWHHRRLLDAKPGITGLWQVSGRSRTTFDEMVRLDLRYARSWSLWLDFRILARTPRAVFSGQGAY